MADILPATIIAALLDDERTRDATQLTMAAWLVNRAWQMNFIVYEGLEAQIAMRPADIYKDDGIEFGEQLGDEWVKMFFVLDSDSFGDEGPAAARLSAEKLRGLADEIDFKALAGEYGLEKSA